MEAIKTNKRATTCKCYYRMRCVFSRFLKMGKDSAARIELGRPFHQMGIVN